MPSDTMPIFGCWKDLIKTSLAKQSLQVKCAEISHFAYATILIEVLGRIGYNQIKGINKEYYG